MFFFVWYFGHSYIDKMKCSYVSVKIVHSYGMENWMDIFFYLGADTYNLKITVDE